MAYQLKQKKRLPRQMNKICSKMMRNILSELARRSIRTRGNGVHNARKRLKQLRGMLRLLHHGIPKSRYKRENRVFRDAAHPLSTVRDADVMIETLDTLIEHYGDQVKPKSFSKLSRALLERRASIRKQVLGKEGAMGKVSASLKQSVPRIKKWTSIPNDYKILLQGITSTYMEGKQELGTVLQKTSTETLHKWRKSVKYLRYQLDVLEPIWPAVIGPLVQESHHLADLLGLDHDLSVLEHLVETEFSDLLQSTQKELLLALANRRRTELQEESIVIGQKLFAESEKQFTKRLKGYWKSWDADASVPPVA